MSKKKTLHPKFNKRRVPAQPASHPQETQPFTTGVNSTPAQNPRTIDKPGTKNYNQDQKIPNILQKYINFIKKSRTFFLGRSAQEAGATIQEMVNDIDKMEMSNLPKTDYGWDAITYITNACKNGLTQHGKYLRNPVWLPNEHANSSRRAYMR